MDKEKAIQFKHLKELYRINPDITAGDLIKLAEYYVDTCSNIDDTIKNQGDTVRIQRVANIVVNEYKNTNEQVQEEYKQKFLADIEKLKAEKEKKYNENEVK
jgi:hypothetical protein